MKNMLKLLKVADIFTLLNGLCGLLSIIFSIQGKLLIAAILLLVAVLFDFLDGKVARLMKQESVMGKSLDSLADIISFGVAPFVFVYVQIQSLLAIVFFMIFVLAGIIRLANYNAEKSAGFFQGVPITVNGILIPLLYFFKLKPVFFPYVLLIMAILMVAPIKVKKVV